MIARIPKETCQPCKKFINIGQPLLECEKCSTAIHTKCHKSGRFSCINNQWLCQDCQGSILPRYNPFAYINAGLQSDKFHENDDESIDEILQCVVSIHERCQPYEIKELDKLTEHLKHQDTSPLSTIFLNIDGNLSNSLMS